jgi:hypothetical protein
MAERRVKATEKTQDVGAVIPQAVTAQALDSMLNILAAARSLTPHLWLEAAKKQGIDTLIFCEGVQLLSRASLIRLSQYSGSGLYELYSLTAKVPPH